MRGDVGGFDVGGSDLTWNLFGAVNMQLSDRMILHAGCRILDLEFDDGSGASEVSFDLQLYGPFLGLSFVF